MSILINKENVILGDLVVVKFPVTNDYEMNDYTFCRDYDCWIPLDKKVSIFFRLYFPSSIGTQ